ncbi:interferon-induced protein with tetratricopeptide repeats 5-like [Tiliqua scincoides]|uniref:interferon-induced protein with tetratricopeptide repeats 5-like n=1 Tax=Tiliqua scincoides TaxID=71010 RepID=UPI003461F874
MSEISKHSLKESLLQLECHFTWMLLKEDIDPEELEERIEDQIEFLLFTSKTRNYNLLAYVQSLRGKNKEALKNLQRAEETVKIEYPKEFEKESLIIWSNYAWVFYQMDKLKEVQIYLKKVASTCKEHRSASPYNIKFPQLYCEKGWALLKFGGKYYEKAKESFAKALEYEPENPEFNSGYAITVYRLEDFYEKKVADGSSLELLRHALRLNPEDAFLMPILALKLQETNQAEEGGKYIKEALEKYPDIPYVLRYAAKFYRKAGDVKRALQLLRDAINLQPNSGFLHHQIGLCYRTQYWDLKKATSQHRGLMAELLRRCIFHFKQVVEHKTKFVFAHLDLAGMYAEGKRYPDAEEMFQKVSAMSKLTLLEKQEFHLCYGCYQEYHKKSESDAIKQYLEGLKIENDSYPRNKCKFHLEKIIKKAIKGGFCDANKYGVLGYIHKLDGEKQQAIECYEKAHRMDPDNEEYFSALCDLKLYLEDQQPNPEVPSASSALEATALGVAKMP